MDCKDNKKRCIFAPQNICYESFSEKKKELVLFGGTLKDYAEMLLKDGRGDGSVVCLGEVHETVIKELSRRDIQLADTRIIVDQHSVTKYFAHPKNQKGAVLPMSEYGLIEEAVKMPLKIYEDASHGDLVNLTTIKAAEPTTTLSHGESFRQQT